MRALVWIDHGSAKVFLSDDLGDWKNMRGVVTRTMEYSYSKEEIAYVSEANSEYEFENRVKEVTADDECFEHFEFVGAE